jgi:hypothetical protein
VPSLRTGGVIPPLPHIHLHGMHTGSVFFFTLQYVSKEAVIKEFYESPSPITFSTCILLNALGTVVTIVTMLWA